VVPAVGPAGARRAGSRARARHVGDRIPWAAWAAAGGRLRGRWLVPLELYDGRAAIPTDRRRPSFYTIMYECIVYRKFLLLYACVQSCIHTAQSGPRRDGSTTPAASPRCFGLLIVAATMLYELKPGRESQTAEAPCAAAPLSVVGEDTGGWAHTLGQPVRYFLRLLPPQATIAAPGTRAVPHWIAHCLALMRRTAYCAAGSSHRRHSMQYTVRPPPPMQLTAVVSAAHHTH
jgi:hypothetical protein